ncbi:hypothetical protein ScPMuIL_007955 [Solemya velum]
MQNPGLQATTPVMAHLPITAGPRTAVCHVTQSSMGVPIPVSSMPAVQCQPNIQNITPLSTVATFRGPIAQPMPAQIFPTGPQGAPIAVPLSPNILQVAGSMAQAVAGNLAQAQLFTTQSGISQFQQVFISQQPGIITSVPNLVSGAMPVNPTVPTTNPSAFGCNIHPAFPTIQAPVSFINNTAPAPAINVISQNIDHPTDLSKRSLETKTGQMVETLAPTIAVQNNSPSAIPVCSQSPINPQQEVINQERSLIALSESRDDIGVEDNTLASDCVFPPNLEEDNEAMECDPQTNHSIDIADYNEDGVPIEYNEPEFIWEEYLQEAGATAVPPTAFKHVEYSLQSGFVKGMKLEVPNKCNPNTYWVASVIITCGPLLRLRFDGYDENSSADFWCDILTSEIHTIGWCAQNGKTLQPPDAIAGMVGDCHAFLLKTLTGARTAPSYLLDKTTGITPIDQLKQGMWLELQDALNPMEIWLVRIIENVGGRLYLRYEGSESASHDFWLFYLHHSIHPVGWGNSNDCSYKPPKLIIDDHPKAKWDEILKETLAETQKVVLPIDIFKDQVEIIQHQFQKGWKLEALKRNGKNQISPATVVKVFNDKYFLVEIDDLQVEENKPRIQFSCHARSRGIFPIQWCQWKGIRLTPPNGWNRLDFQWNVYLASCNAMAAPDNCFNLDKPEHEFARAMKLEAVNPENPNQICAATITKIIDQLLWVHLDNSSKIVASQIEDIDSFNLFPVGWCESNGYQLKPPRKSSLSHAVHKRVAVVQPELSGVVEETKKSTSPTNTDTNSSSWCPKIYFNHRCFSGPYLSKGRISELPKCVGPGPIILVMKEVLSMLINVAYKSCRVLRELQLDAPSNPKMYQQTLKAKYKGKSYRATVEICRSTDQLEEFCRQVCIRLECCPYLFSPHLVENDCPENCSQLTKTKYTYYYGKKRRKIGRPPGGHSNLENGPKKPGKRRKKRKILIHRKTHPSQDGNFVQNDDDNQSDISDTKTVESNDSNYSMDSEENGKGNKLKRKYTHKIPPPSDIKTRGAKLPKYSFERKTHKKIMHSPMAAHSKKTKKMPMSVPTSSSGYEIKPEDILKLDSNPLKWSVSEVIKFIRNTDCAHLARIFKDQEIDGQALLLLTLPTVQEYMDLKLGPAIKLCHQIERVKIAFYEQYA